MEIAHFPAAEQILYLPVKAGTILLLGQVTQEMAALPLTVLAAAERVGTLETAGTGKTVRAVTQAVAVLVALVAVGTMCIVAPHGQGTAVTVVVVWASWALAHQVRAAQ